MSGGGMTEGGSLDLLWCSFPDAASANAIAAQLVSEGHVACAQVLAPMTAHYRWQGTQERDDEVPMLCKLAAGQGAMAAARLGELHPDDLPAISWWPAACSPAVAAWTRDV
jgi:periplasmic divalent cation tolerance protein